MTSNGKSIVEALSSSKLYQDYCRAFNDLTGLPLTLRPIESWQLPYHGKRNENAYCAMMALKEQHLRVLSPDTTAPLGIGHQGSADDDLQLRAE